MNKKIQTIKEMAGGRPELTKDERAWLKENNYNPMLKGVILKNASEADYVIATAINEKIKDFGVINLIHGKHETEN